MKDTGALTPDLERSVKAEIASRLQELKRVDALIKAEIADKQAAMAEAEYEAKAGGSSGGGGGGGEDDGSARAAAAAVVAMVEAQHNQPRSSIDKTLPKRRASAVGAGAKRYSVGGGSATAAAAANSKSNRY